MRSIELYLMKPKYIVGEYTASIFKCLVCNKKWLQRPSVIESSNGDIKIKKTIPKNCTDCKNKDWKNDKNK